MSIIQSKLNTRSPEFQANQALMKNVVSDLRDKAQAISAGGTPGAREKHQARGKLLVRERVDLLLDPGSPFLELSPLAANDMYDNGVPCAGGSLTAVGIAAISTARASYSSSSNRRARAMHIRATVCSGAPRGCRDGGHD